MKRVAGALGAALVAGGFAPADPPPPIPIAAELIELCVGNGTDYGAMAALAKSRGYVQVSSQEKTFEGTVFRGVMRKKFGFAKLDVTMLEVRSVVPGYSLTPAIACYAESSTPQMDAGFKLQEMLGLPLEPIKGGEVQYFLSVVGTNAEILPVRDGKFTDPAAAAKALAAGQLRGFEVRFYPKTTYVAYNSYLPLKAASK